MLLSDHPDGFPAEPFDGSPATEAYWTTLVTLHHRSRASRWRVARFDQPTSASFRLPWSAAQLALVAARRVTRADASLSVIGLPPRQVQAPFQRTLTVQPPQVVRNHIRASLASRRRARLQLGHLVEFLTADAALDFLRQQNAGVDRFLDAMTGPLGTLAQHRQRRCGRLAARPDAQATLEGIATSLRTFMVT